MTIYIKKALDAGANRDEILEASTVSILMSGGAALMYVAEVKKLWTSLSRHNKKDNLRPTNLQFIKI
ncbi:MAG: hypothetical protein U9O96_01620 [Candidatus Thermoplasmatota archaeon]|nr:hypothetical protein [Candidatus Thermoplasmatota archaeon]